MKSKLGLNPWLSILTKPRQTIKAVVEFNANYHLLLLSILYGFSAILGIAQRFKAGEKLDFMSIIIPAIILAPVWGYIIFSVSAWFVYITGKILKGKAKYRHIRAAIAWSNVPSIVSCILWGFLIFSFGGNLFGNFATKETFTTGQVWSIFSVMFVMLIVSIWSLVIYINALAEVQKISIMKAILNIIMAAVVVLIITFLIALILNLKCSSFFDSSSLVLLF